MRTRQLFTSLAVVLLFACGGGEKKQGWGGAGDKNTLVMMMKSSPTNLDVRVGNDNAAGRVHELINSGLIRVTPNMDYAPDVAEKWETPDDRTIVFHLNPKAKFHNGQPVLAKDVKWTYESLLAPNFTSSKKSGYAAVDHIEAPDDHTIIFKLKQPNAGIFDNLTLGILPTGADTNVYKTKPIGCGAYKVIDYRPDDRLELEAFDDWHLGAPHIKHVTIRIIPDLTTAVLELRRGTVNMEVNIIPFENVPEFEKSPDFKIVKSPGSVYQYLAFNMKDPILAKREVRQAIAYAIDRDRIIRDLQRGYATKTD
nr:ABC transporter substrate-binding protein [Acidobacteriota bacterium]